MTTLAELLAAVDGAFVDTARGLEPWPDPHPDRSPHDEEYSRVTNPERWRIVSARAEAWEVALADLGVATVERGVRSRWIDGNLVAVARVDRLRPMAAGALPVLVARTTIDDVADFGVVLGFGDPAVVVERFPDCGCDACDSGSADELEHLDEYLVAIVCGEYRQAGEGSTIRSWRGSSQGSSWSRGRRITEPYDLSGAPWVEGTGSRRLGSTN